MLPTDSKNIMDIKNLLATAVNRRNERRKKIRQMFRNIRNSIQRFFERSPNTSKFGMLLQFFGVVALLTGLYLVYAPLSFLVAGLGLLMIGERV